MSEMKIFENPEFGKIRTVAIEGEPWFVGKDVARALEYSNHRKALDDHVEDEDKRQGDGVTIRDSMGREQHPTIINESGVYSLIFSSKLPKAKEFKHWVTSEVLPSIRKTGGYMSEEAAQQTMTALAELTDRVNALSNAMSTVVYSRAQPEVSLTGLARVITATRRVMRDMGSHPEQIGAVTRSILNTCGFHVPEFKREPLIRLEDFF